MNYDVMDGTGRNFFAHILGVQNSDFSRVIDNEDTSSGYSDLYCVVILNSENDGE